MNRILLTTHRAGTGKLGIIIGAVLALISSQSAHAALNVKLSEFIGLNTGNLGTVGAVEGWSGSTGNITVTNGSGSLNGTSLGLLASAGDKVYINATDSLTTFNLFADSGTFPPGTATNVYYSFLYKFN